MLPKCTEEEIAPPHISNIFLKLSAEELREMEKLTFIKYYTMELLDQNSDNNCVSFKATSIQQSTKQPYLERKMIWFHAF